MAWLNLNKDFEFYDDEEKFYNYLGIIEECPLPFRESFRTHEMLKQGWNFGDWKRGEHVDGVPIWKFIDRLLENNVGKSFDETFSYYCRKTKHIHNDKYHRFLKEFESPLSYYIVDEDGNIQYGEYLLRQGNRGSSNEPYTFKSADYTTQVVHKHTGESLESWIIRDPWKRSISKHIEKHTFINVLTNGYYVENVIPKSKLEKRLKWEYRQKTKQLNKIRDTNRKNKVYSFLTRKEEELKKSKLEDENILLRKGFDSESFKGEYYHGRKNKKKWRNLE